MTTAPTPAQRLDRLRAALAARLRRGPDAEALHPLYDLANIVRDLHKGAQGAPGAPEATPEGDGTTTPVSGPQNGARRFKVGDLVRVIPGPNGHRMPRCGEYGAVTKDGPHVTHVRHADGDVEPYIDELLEPVAMPTTPGSVVWLKDGSIHGLTADVGKRPWFSLRGTMGALEDLAYHSATDHILNRSDVVRIFDAGDGA